MYKVSGIRYYVWEFRVNLYGFPIGVGNDKSVRLP